MGTIVHQHLRNLNHILFFGAMLISVVGCKQDAATSIDAGVDDDDTIQSDFDAHTRSHLETEEELLSMLEDDTQRVRLLKMVITDLELGTAENHFYEPGFYTFHDEWYWYYLLNGQQLPGSAMEDIYAGDFDSIAAIYSWANALTDLPLDLRFTRDGRLYSNRFYEHGMRRVTDSVEKNSRPRMWIAVSLVVDTADLSQIGFTVEYRDLPQHHELIRMFEVISKGLPEPYQHNLVWYTRSPEHREIAEAFIAEYPSYAERIRGYDELSQDGEYEIYNTGTAAGRLRIVESEDDLNALNANDIAIFKWIPDELPQCAAVITTVPQTALAHISLLAKNRGIPNLYWAGADSDPNIDQIMRASGYARLKVESEDFNVRSLTRAEYLSYRNALTLEPLEVPQGQLEVEPGLKTAEAAFQVSPELMTPYIGGKAAGFYYLLNAPGVRAPPEPVFITKQYDRLHRTQVASELSEILSEGRFYDQRDLRRAVLEGEGDYSPFGVSASLVEIAEAGGVVTLIEEAEMNSNDAEEIRLALRSHFLDNVGLSTAQGLRFRSSSTVEDLEGFNGAGLYRSRTGFFEEEEKRSFEEAIKDVWASYWGLEAFDERELFQIDHLSGSMAVVVHPRFDDDKELANGVAVLTVYTDGRVDGVVNVQTRDISVANPEAGILPESISISGREDALQFELLQRSTEIPTSDRVLTQELLDDLMAQMINASTFWLSHQNELVADSMRRTLVTLDFEFKWMDADWPAYADGRATPAGIVLKQLRTLEPSIRWQNQTMRELDAPADRKNRTDRLLSLVCSGEEEHTLEMIYLEMNEIGEIDFGDSHYIQSFHLSDTVELELNGSEVIVTDLTMDEDGGLSFMELQYGDEVMTFGLSTSTLSYDERQFMFQSCETAVLYQDPSHLLL